MRILLTRTSQCWNNSKIIEIDDEKFFEYLKNLQADVGFTFVIDTNRIVYNFRDRDITDYHTNLIKRYENILEMRTDRAGKEYIIPCDINVEIYDNYRE